MKNLKTYEQIIFESNSDLTLKDVIHIYHDCFIDLYDMGAYIGVSDTKHYNDIDDVMSGKSPITGWSYYNSKINFNDFILDFGIFGRAGKRNESSDQLEKIYNYLRDNLQNDEDRFEDSTGLKIKNRHTTVSVREWDVYPDDKRYEYLVNKNKVRGRYHYSISFGKDMDGRGYVDYNIYINRGILYDNPDLTTKIKRKINKFVDWMKSKGDRYTFPEITDKMEIKQIEISHEVTDPN